MSLEVYSSAKLKPLRPGEAAFTPTTGKVTLHVDDLKSIGVVTDDVTLLIDRDRKFIAFRKPRVAETTMRITRHAPRPNIRVVHVAGALKKLRVADLEPFRGRVAVYKVNDTLQIYFAQGAEGGAR